MKRHPPVDPPDPIDVLPTRRGYDRWAEIYDEEENPLVVLEEPLVAALLGDVRGLRVADVGCGTGRHALALAAAGARVTALDFSQSMLEKARAKPGADAVDFIPHDLTTPLPCEADSFDRVTCCLVLDHISDPEFLFCELKRICRDDGFIVASVMHPAMMLRGVQARFTDPATGRETRPESVPNLIADYVMAVSRAGLRFTHMSEHAVDEALAERAPRARKHLGWPLLLMMRLRSI
jgi:malonyl-CoA O-methyltransferase